MTQPSAQQVVRWQREPCAFIEEALHDPETGRPFKLLDAERDFLGHAFKVDSAGRLLYPEQIFQPRKSPAKPALRPCTCFARCCYSVASILRGMHSRMTWNKRPLACFRPSSGSLSRRHCWQMAPRS